MDFEGFVALGEAYKSNKSAYQVLNAFLDDIRDELGGVKPKGFMITLEKRSGIGKFVEELKTEGIAGVVTTKETAHFNAYFRDDIHATVLIITSKNKNILLVPKNKYSMLHDFAYGASKEDHDDFWVLFFAFLKEYQDEMEKLDFNTARGREEFP